MNSTIAVLLTCHNRQKKTLKCLDNLFKAMSVVSENKFQIYLVDDGSTDGTGDAVRTKYPDINVINGSGKLFWNRGMYTAWNEASKADYDYYLWLNDDTNLFPDSLQKLLKWCHDEKQDKAIIVGATCSTENKLLTYSGYYNEIQITPGSDLKICDYFHGNCVLVPRCIFKKVGNLDKSFPHAIGDFDYGFRARKAGFKSFISAGYTGYCESNKSLPQWCLSEISLKNRLKALYSPLGNAHPVYFFKYEYRHFGFHIAILHFITIHFRLFFPHLWKKKIL